MDAHRVLLAWGRGKQRTQGRGVGWARGALACVCAAREQRGCKADPPPGFQTFPRAYNQHHT